MRRSIHYSMMILAGLLVLFSAQMRQVRADEASNKDTIVQGVRDDVRRKIQENSEKPTEKSEELASRARQQQPVAPEPASPKQESAK